MSRVWGVANRAYYGAIGMAVGQRLGRQSPRESWIDLDPDADAAGPTRICHADLSHVGSPRAAGGRASSDAQGQGGLRTGERVGAGLGRAGTGAAGSQTMRMPADHPSRPGPLLSSAYPKMTG